MFIRIEDKIVNTNCIEYVTPNKVIVKYGEEFYDADETEVKGITVYMKNNNLMYGLTFESVTMEQFMEMVK